MSLLRQIAIILFVIGIAAWLLGLLGIGTGIAAMSFLKWAIFLAVVLFVAELLTRGRAV